MKKKEIERELEVWKRVARSNVRWVEELKVPIITPRHLSDVTYLYNLYKENDGK